MKGLKLILLNTYAFLFMSHPFLLFLILLILKVILFISIADPYLCDGDSLEESSYRLSLLYEEYKDNNKDYEQYNNLLEQANNRPERDNGIIRYLINKKDSKAIDAACSLSKIRLIETSIKAKDPNFVSTIKKEWYEYF
jgi:hypothetical protein